ncbi:uncharacterized protein LOC119665635 [Teleopsis dalmanni]|uniref:uncharacterized protein LOC119665635 n=1 Tax=Teleopsis dalmanni TaxID=139649 RepID=UPI0018CF9C89|nr:uncharacterized protein LOC119665635 [Teleopsis dalmanni]
MHLRRWNIKKLSIAGIACLVVYFIFSSHFHKYNIDAVISDTHPEEVWEYVADFSKMRLLNPTILNFHVVSDSGHAHDWRYTVIYTERLSHWPYWLNTGKGDYIVKKSMPGVVPQLFTIDSEHETCFFGGFYCLRSISEFKFSSLGKDTYCIDNIQYQCPPFLSVPCRRELEYQRKAIIHNLTAIFNKKQQKI